jgi:hypothetical protein
VNLRAEHLLTEALRWQTLEYGQLRNPNARAEIVWTIGRPGQIHGICLWLEATLTEGVSFSSAPGDTELIYGQGFFPLERPCPVNPGDVVSVSIAANLVGGDYLWRWATKIASADGAGLAEFQQSNFGAAPVSSHTLRRSDIHAVPELGDDGRMELAILRLMDGGSTIEAISERIQADFPDRLANASDALRRVQRVVTRFGA